MFERKVLDTKECDFRASVNNPFGCVVRETVPFYDPTQRWEFRLQRRVKSKHYVQEDTSQETTTVSRQLGE